MLCYCAIFKDRVADVSICNGDKEIRTLDPLLARQVLSQLSYTPIVLIGLSGLEPPTSRLSGVRSNRLSYRPMQGFYWVQFPFPTYINILCFKCSCFHMYIQR